MQSETSESFHWACAMTSASTHSAANFPPQTKKHWACAVTPLLLVCRPLPPSLSPAPLLSPLSHRPSYNAINLNPAVSVNKAEYTASASTSPWHTKLVCEERAGALPRESPSNGASSSPVMSPERESDRAMLANEHCHKQAVGQWHRDRRKTSIVSQLINNCNYLGLVTLLCSNTWFVTRISRVCCQFHN